MHYDRARAGHLAEVAAGLAAGAGVELPDGLALWDLAGGRPATAAPIPSADPAGDLGARLEALLDDGERRRGAHYTPTALADRLAALALPAGRDGPGPVVCDPACGGGAVLLAVARRLARAGHPPAAVASRLLWGADLDPLAAAVSEAAVALWSGGVAPAPGHVVAGDTLLGGRGTWSAMPRLDAVVGNPPFQSQLLARTARAAHVTGELRRRFGREALAPYVDTAALFLLASVDLVRPGGRVVLVQPSSVATSRDARAVRCALAERAGPSLIWSPPSRSFGAAVEVCVPVLEVGRPGPADWGPLLAAGDGVPPVVLRADRRLGDVADVVAGFRDEYYGLVPHTVETAKPDPVLAPLVTCGLVDVGAHAWGARPVRFAKRTWQRPQVDLGSLRRDGGRAWTHVERLRRPKVLVASQTKVAEAAPDPDGVAVPVTPMVSVLPRDDGTSVGALAAMVASPATAAHLAVELAGSGLGRDSLRISAAALAAVPLPAHANAWRKAALAFEAWAAAGAAPHAAGAWARAMLEAQGIAGPDAERLLEWWQPRAFPERSLRSRLG